MDTLQLKELISLVLVVATPVASITGAFYSGQQKLSEFKLQASDTYVKKADFKEMADRQIKMSEDVAEIKGIVKAKLLRQEIGSVLDGKPFASK